MIKRDLKKDFELFNEATPEPWETNKHHPGMVFGETSNGDGIIAITRDQHAYDGDEANAELIAQAREGWPYAIKRVLELEAVCQELTQKSKEVLGCLFKINSLHGNNLKVAGWHSNGELEDFDYIVIEGTHSLEIEKELRELLVKAAGALDDEEVE